jgi:hypothetical protein
MDGWRKGEGEGECGCGCELGYGCESMTIFTEPTLLATENCQLIL